MEAVGYQEPLSDWQKERTYSVPSALQRFPMESPHCPYKVGITFPFTDGEVSLREVKWPAQHHTAQGCGFYSPHDRHRRWAHLNTGSVGIQVAYCQPRPLISIPLQGSPSLPLIRGVAPSPPQAERSRSAGSSPFSSLALGLARGDT